MKARWTKYRSARAVLMAYFAGFDPAHPIRFEDIGEGPLMLEGIRRQGMWAFVETKSKPPHVHYWHAPNADLAELAFMLGHELGHCSGKKLRGFKEELRANEYGDVVRTVFRKLGLVPGGGS